MEEGKYLTTERPSGWAGDHVFPTDWLPAAKAIHRIAGHKGTRPSLQYAAIEYHDEVSFLIGTDGHCAIVAELPPVEGLSGEAFVSANSLSLWIKTKGERADVLEWAEPSFPDVRAPFPGSRAAQDEEDVGLNIALVHRVMTAIRDVRVTGKGSEKAYQQSAWRVASAFDPIHLRAEGRTLNGSEVLLQVLIMPMRLS